jgi:hypothetical protein
MQDAKGPRHPRTDERNDCFHAQPVSWFYKL